MRERTEELEGVIYGKTDVNNKEPRIKSRRRFVIVLARIVVTLMFLACVLFIWHNSMESAAQSSSRSGKVTEAINGVLASVGGGAVTEHFIRKLAHFSEYGLEGVLTVLVFMVYCLKLKEEDKGAERSECASRSAPCLKDMVYCLKPQEEDKGAERSECASRSGGTNCLKSQKLRRAILLTGLLTAIVDESIQFFSAGRSPGAGDVCIDMAGFACGMLFMMAVCYVSELWQVLRSTRMIRRGDYI